MTRRFGHVKLSRKLFTDGSDLWSEPRRFSRFEAWVDLLQLAPWTEVDVSANGHLVTVPRGHVLASVRLLSSRWGWSKSAVDRFLALLGERDTVRAKIGTPLGTLYLIVNYDAYQLGGDSERDSNGTASGTKIKQLEAEKQRDTTTGAADFSAESSPVVGEIQPAAEYQRGIASAINTAADERFGEHPTTVIRWDHPATLECVERLRAADVPLAFAREVITGKVMAMPARPFSARYFTQHVIEAWQTAAAPPAAVGLRAIVNGRKLSPGEQQVANIASLFLPREGA